MNVKEAEVEDEVVIEWDEHDLFTKVLIQYLFKTITTDQLKKIQLICELVLMYKDKIKKEDLNEVSEVYPVVTSLLNAEERTDSIFIAWTFIWSKDNFEKYIAPWLMTMPDFTFMNELEKQVKLRKVFYKSIQVDGKPIMAETEPWERFFIITGKIGVSKVSYGEIKGQFILWAMPKMLRVCASLMGLASGEGEWSEPYTA
jgi:hypothetical protein